MPNKDTTGHIGAALLTVSLIDHSKMPDELSDVILEKIIEMADECKVNVWHNLTGLHAETLGALYSMYETGAGYRRVRLYGEYEASRTKRSRRKK